jgi:Mor family transcriptional regulator
MNIKVGQIIGSDRAISSSDGEKLYEVLFHNFFEIRSLDFTNIKYLSSAFLNESLGKIVLVKNNDLNGVKFVYPEGNSIFSSKVKDVIQNSLLGDVYDSMVDNAAAGL